MYIEIGHFVSGLRERPAPRWTGTGPPWPEQLPGPEDQTTHTPGDLRSRDYPMISPGTQPEKAYFRSIDGLRLIASINIVLFHLSLLGGLNDIQLKSTWLYFIITGPAFHASLFFVLGGFIYTAKHAGSARTFDTLKFLKRRILILMPLHIVMTLTMVPITIIDGLKAGELPLGKLFASLFMHLSMLWSIFPLETFSLNTPSWALSVFFICFALFGPMLKLVTAIASRRMVILTITAAIAAIAAWWIGYVRLGRDDLYFFFHVFAPIRLLEFGIGMLLAQLYILNTVKPRKFRIQEIPFFNDFLIAGAIIAVLFNVYYFGARFPGSQVFSYHVVTLPLFSLLLYRLARGTGIIAGFFAIPFIRKIGVCSFYPYLVHVPLAAWTALIASRLGYERVFFSPLNLVIFMVLLYGVSAIIWRQRRGKLPERAEIAGNDHPSDKTLGVRIKGGPA